MPSSDDVQGQQTLLAQYRRTLLVLLGQRAAAGKDFVQPSVVNGIDDARFHIQQIKATLRSWDVPVEDLPNDAESVPPLPAVTATLPASAKLARSSVGSRPRTLIVAASILIIIVLYGFRSLGADNQRSNEPTPSVPTDISGTVVTNLPTAAALTLSQPLPTVDSIPTANSVSSPSVEAGISSNGPSLSAFEINEAIQTITPDFDVKLLQVRVLPTDIMEWKLELWNKTGQPQAVYMANGSYVVDDIGNKYDIIQGLGVPIQVGERSEQTITFKAPKPGGSAYSLYINNSIGVQFPKPALSFSKTLNPGSMVEPTQIPADKNTLVVNETVPNNVTDFEMKVTTIQILPANVMRWNFDVWNKSGAPQTVYMASGSYIIDDQGNKFDLIDGMGFTFQAGERSQQGITFNAPKTIGTTYSLYVNNSIGVQFQRPAVTVTITQK